MAELDENENIVVRDYEEITKDLNGGVEINALDRFIISNEPAGQGQDKRFRAELKSAILFVQIHTRKE